MPAIADSHSPRASRESRMAIQTAVITSESEDAAPLLGDYRAELWGLNLSPKGPKRMRLFKNERLVLV